MRNFGRSIGSKGWTGLCRQRRTCATWWLVADYFGGWLQAALKLRALYLYRLSAGLRPCCEQLIWNWRW